MVRHRTTSRHRNNVTGFLLACGHTVYRSPDCPDRVLSLPCSRDGEQVVLRYYDTGRPRQRQRGRR